MNIEARLAKLEAIKDIRYIKGLPLRPRGMSDTDYEQAIINKRRELGLQDSEQIALLELCMQKAKTPNGITSFERSSYEY